MLPRSGASGGVREHGEAPSRAADAGHMAIWALCSVCRMPVGVCRRPRAAWRGPRSARRQPCPVPRRPYRTAPAPAAQAACRTAWPRPGHTAGCRRTTGRPGWTPRPGRQVPRCGATPGRGCPPRASPSVVRNGQPVSVPRTRNPQTGDFAPQSRGHSSHRARAQRSVREASARLPDRFRHPRGMRQRCPLAHHRQNRSRSLDGRPTHGPMQARSPRSAQSAQTGAQPHTPGARTPVRRRNLAIRDNSS